MNLHNAWNHRENLNLKMLTLLLQGLKNQLESYHRACANYDAERMAKYGTPFIDHLEFKIETVKSLISKKNG